MFIFKKFRFYKKNLIFTVGVLNFITAHQMKFFNNYYRVRTYINFDNSLTIFCMYIIKFDNTNCIMYLHDNYLLSCTYIKYILQMNNKLILVDFMYVHEVQFVQNTLGSDSISSKSRSVHRTPAINADANKTAYVGAYMSNQILKLIRIFA